MEVPLIVPLKNSTSWLFYFIVWWSCSTLGILRKIILACWSWNKLVEIISVLFLFNSGNFQLENLRYTLIKHCRRDDLTEMTSKKSCWITKSAGTISGTNLPQVVGMISFLFNMLVPFGLKALHTFCHLIHFFPSSPKRTRSRGLKHKMSTTQEHQFER